MSIQAVFVPFEKNFIEELSNELITHMRGDDLSHTAVVFPGKRPYYYLISSLSRTCKRTIFPPLITSMDEFISKLLSWNGFEFSSMSELDAVYILHKILKGENLHRDLPAPYRESFETFEDFLFWGFEILKILEEMDEGLVDERKIEEVKNFMLTGAAFSSLSPHEKITLLLGDLLFRFHEEMERNRLWTRGYRYRKAASLPVSEILKEKNIEKVFLAGFFLFTRSEMEVIKKAGESVDLCLFFHISEREKWKEFEGMLKNLGVKTLRELPPQKGVPPEDKFSFHPASSLHFELFHLSLILKDEKGWNELGIVLPRSDALIPLLSEVVSRYNVEFNVSMGYPLSRTPLFSLVVSVLTLQETKDNGLYYLPPYLSLIKHPYVKNIYREKRKIFRKIEEELVRKKLLFFTLDDVEEMVDEDSKETVRNFHEIFVKSFENIRTLQSLGSAFENLVRFLVEKSEFPAHPLSSEILDGFMTFLNDMKKSLVKNEEFEMDSLKRIFTGLAGNCRIALPGVPLRGTQIIGMLETRCLNFKRLIILDVNEGIIPGVRKYDPILSPSIRKRIGIPTYRDNELIYRYHFFRAVNSAERVMIFYIKNPEMPRSRFVEEILWEIEKDKRKTVLEDEMRIPVQVFLPEKVGEVKKDPQTMELLKEMKFTPTGIDVYLKCPLRFYFEEVLKLSPTEYIEEDVEPKEVGNVAHLALQRIFEPFLNKPLFKEDFQKMKESVEKNVKSAMEEELPVRTPERDLLEKILIKAIEKYIDRESELFNSSSIKVLELENKWTMTLRVGERDVEITGKWDRVDEVKDRIRIVDYKTGGAGKFEIKKKIMRDSFENFSRCELKKKGINSLQLPCYVFIYKEKNKPSLPVEACVIALKKVFKEKEWLVKLSEEISQDLFRKMITGIIMEIMDPDVPFYADADENCSRCSYRTPCLSTRMKCSQ